MEPLPLVTTARHVEGFRIRLTFNDGLEAIVDCEDWLSGPIFEPLKEPDAFQRFFVEAGGVTWPNGSDLAPEAFYERAKASSAA